MIIGPLSPAVKRFCRQFLSGVDGFGVWAALVLPILLHGLLLATKRRTLRTLGEATLLHWVCTGTVCRWLARLRFPVDRWHEHACRQLLAMVARWDGKGDWVLIFDGSDTKRGGLAKVQNTRRYGKKPKKGKGARPSTKTHTFLFGLLILPCGLRLPLPRKSWYTRAYAREKKLPYRSQVELAAELLTWFRPLLPAKQALIVLGDSLFDGQRLFTLCRDWGFTFITKLKRNRTFADAPGKRVVAHGEALAESLFQCCRLCRGKEATANYRRQPPRRPRTHEKREYFYHSERRHISRMGEALVVYSWKTPVDKKQAKQARGEFATLVTNNWQLAARQVVEYYELRWQIEVFFRELKGQLGLQDYQGTSFPSYERFLTLVLMGYMVLEYQRFRGLKGQAKAEEPRGGWATARTAALLQQVRREAQRADIHWIGARLQTRKGRRQLRQALQRAA